MADHFDRLREVLERQEKLAAFRYFTDLDNADTCPTCAIGALIRGLPPEDFQGVVAILRTRETLSLGAGTLINALPLTHSALAPVRELLVKHYGAPEQDLVAIQGANDHGVIDSGKGEATMARREVVLQRLDWMAANDRKEQI